MPDIFRNRAILVAGATGGLGTAIVREFARTEAHLILTSLSEQALQQLVKDTGLPDERALIMAADVTRPGEVQGLVAAVLERFGRLDVLLNTVGGWAGGHKVSDGQADSGKQGDDGALFARVEMWKKMLTLNLDSAFLLSWAALPPMLEAGWGRIIHVSSRTAVQPRAKAAGYAVSKMGVITLTEVIAAEVKGSGVTANVILPSTIDTPDNRRMMPKADPGDWVPPEQIASTMRFLCSEAAASINGARIAIYGAA